MAACGRRDFNIPTDATNPDDATLAEEFPTKRSTLRLNRVTNTETLEDVPLLVTLDDTRADRTTLRADAGDLRFRDADGNATVWLKGGHVFTTDFAVTNIGDPVYITPAGALSGTAAGNALFGHALSTKGAPAGPLTVRIAN